MARTITTKTFDDLGYDIPDYGPHGDLMTHLYAQLRDALKSGDAAAARRLARTITQEHKGVRRS